MKRPLSHAVAEEANLPVKAVKKTIGSLFEVMVRELRAGEQLDIVCIHFYIYIYI